jgi:hypothetical protein
MSFNVIDLNTVTPLFFKEGLGEILEKAMKNPPESPFIKEGAER